MSHDVHSQSRIQHIVQPVAQAVEIQPDTGLFYEQVESVLLVLVSALASVLISAIWVSLSLG